VSRNKSGKLSSDLFTQYFHPQDGSLDTAHADPDTAVSSLKAKVETVSQITEKQMIVDALNKTNQNRTRAAELLGISRRTLQNKIKEYNL